MGAVSAITIAGRKDKEAAVRMRLQKAMDKMKVDKALAEAYPEYCLKEKAFKKLARDKATAAEQEAKAAKEQAKAAEQAAQQALKQAAVAVTAARRPSASYRALRLICVWKVHAGFEGFWGVLPGPRKKEFLSQRPVLFKYTCRVVLWRWRPAR